MKAIEPGPVFSKYLILYATCLLLGTMPMPLFSKDVQPLLKQPATGNASSPIALHLYSYGYGARGVEVFYNAVVNTLTAAGESVSETYYEYLDLERNNSADYRSRMINMLMKKYQARNVAVIITGGVPALDFLLNEGRGFAASAPAITIQAPVKPLSALKGRRIVTLLPRFDIEGTLFRILDIFPETKQVLIVTGSSSGDRLMMLDAEKVMSGFKHKFKAEYTIDRSLEEILERASKMPPQSVIVFIQYNTDSKGKVAPAYEVEAKIIRIANAPVFGLYDFNLKNGGIGGSVISVNEMGVAAAKLSRDIKLGVFIPSEPITRKDVSAINMFDWEKIKFWGGRVDRLPVGTVLLNKPVSLWDGHKEIVVGATALILILALLAIALAVSMWKRKRVEETLRESEARFLSFMNQTPVFAYIKDSTLAHIYENTRVTELARESLSKEELNSARTIFDKTTADLLETADEKILSGKSDMLNLEYAITNKGELRWLSDYKFAIEVPGKPRMIGGLAFDITDRKKAEHAIEKSLQEKEVLLREIYHRSKNTMQIIQGIIVLQANEFPGVPEVTVLVKNTRNRIQAISLVHQMLYQSKDLSEISIRKYIQDLCELIKQSYGFTDDRITFIINVDDLHFLIDISIPLGLILNELITNSIKHAFPGGHKGTIEIALTSKNPETYLLKYSDNGVGVPAEFDFKKQESLGMKLIHGIAEGQLSGRMMIENKDGIKFSLEFPGNLYNARI